MSGFPLQDMVQLQSTRPLFPGTSTCAYPSSPLGRPNSWNFLCVFFFPVRRFTGPSVPWIKTSPSFRLSCLLYLNFQVLYSYPSQGLRSPSLGNILPCDLA